MQSVAAGIPIPAPRSNFVARSIQKFSYTQRDETRYRLTNITPDWSRVIHIPTPNESVHKFEKTRYCCPNHECASARIPSLNVPWQRYKTDQETKKSEDGEEWVSWVVRLVHDGASWTVWTV
jgi:hypothetical protein